MTETYTITAPVEAFASLTIDLKDLGEVISPHIVTDNDNTEQVLGVNKIEEMIDNMLRDHDFSSTIGDVIDYNYDFVTECDVVEIVRDYCDGEGYNDTLDLDPIREEVNNLRPHIMSMQAEIDFLHEKYLDLYESRLSYRIGEAARAIASLPARLWARVPKFTIKRKDG